MLNANNALRKQRVEAGVIQSIFGAKPVGNRRVRRAEYARRRQKVSTLGRVDAHTESLNDEFSHTIFGPTVLHPTKGYRVMSPRRSDAQAEMIQKYGFVR